MEIVIYDEIEKFRHYHHPDFNYPFEKRKVQLSELELDFDVRDYKYNFNAD